MRRNDTAVVLFTLSAEAEGRRKVLGTGAQTTAVFSRLIDRAQEVCESLPGVDLLVASPAGQAPARGIHFPQRGATFGQSLEFAVRDVFALGYRRVLLLGNDAPEINRGYLVEALARLDRAGAAGKGAVLGPARDGGYALLGLTRDCEELFRRMPWGSSEVGDLTAERLDRAGFTTATMPVVGDLDDARDLACLFAQRRRAAVADSATGMDRLEFAALLCELSRVLTPFHHEASSLTCGAVGSRSIPSLRAPPAAA